MWYNIKLCVFRKRGNRSLLLDCSLTKAYLTFQCQPGFLLYAVVNPFVGMADGISMTMLSYICRGCCFVKQKITCQCSLGIHHVLSSFKFMHPSCSTLAIAAKLSEVKCLKVLFLQGSGSAPRGYRCHSISRFSDLAWGISHVDLSSTMNASKSSRALIILSLH